MSDSRDFRAGSAVVRVVGTEEAMGAETARKVADQLLCARTRGLRPVLWLMAAPSAFAFYRAFVARCRDDGELRSLLQDVPFYQFDDYPVARTDARFAVTFRALLETHLFTPLQEACGRLPGIRPLELTGTDRDPEIARAYGEEIGALLDDPGCFVIQLKGIGMDGHWGFHGADTPLDAPAGIIEVPIGPQNVRQQRIDWPDLFPRDEDVPSVAYTGTVELFMRADYVIDNVPQPSKQFSVLATYGNDAVIGEVPSSALKRHPDAEAIVTAAAAGALLDYREQLAAGRSTLTQETLRRLDHLWDDEQSPETAESNRRIMHEVLEKLGMVG